MKIFLKEFKIRENVKLIIFSQMIIAFGCKNFTFDYAQIFIILKDNL